MLIILFAHIPWPPPPLQVWILPCTVAHREQWGLNASRLSNLSSKTSGKHIYIDYGMAKFHPLSLFLLALYTSLIELTGYHRVCVVQVTDSGSLTPPFLSHVCPFFVSSFSHIIFSSVLLYRTTIRYVCMCVYVHV